MRKSAEQFGRTPMDIQEGRLVHAPWNPREKITPESVAELTASIRANGLVQRIAVIAGGTDGTYTVVAGNRRLVACREAGMKTVPCEVLEVDEAAARKLTLIENLQRKDVNPVLEAALIGKLAEDGMTHAEIAAEIGASERFVARRARLSGLSESWRRVALAGYPFRVDCLENIARHPEGMQEAVFGDRFDEETAPEYAEMNAWADYEWHFKRLTRELSDVPWDTDGCLECPHNTACQPELFDLDEDEDGDGERLGRCTNPECFGRRGDEHREGLVAALGPHAVEVDGYGGFPRGSVDHADDAHTVPYYFLNTYNVGITVRWADPREIERERRERDEASNEAKVEKARLKLERSAVAKVVAWWKERGLAEMSAYAEGFGTLTLADRAKAVKTLCAFKVALNVPDWRFCENGRDRLHGFACRMLNPEGLTEDDAQFVAESIADGVGGASAESARAVVRLFPESGNDLTDAERTALMGEEEGAE